MKEYIEREALLKYIEETIENSGCVNHEGEIIDCVRYAPTADVVERVRGEWVLCYEDDRRQIDGDKCTACGFEHYGNCISHYHFCPNCGADMRGEKHEQ